MGVHYAKFCNGCGLAGGQAPRTLCPGRRALTPHFPGLGSSALPISHHTSLFPNCKQSAAQSSKPASGNFGARRRGVTSSKSKFVQNFPPERRGSSRSGGDRKDLSRTLERGGTCLNWNDPAAHALDSSGSRSIDSRFAPFRHLRRFPRPERQWDEPRSERRFVLCPLGDCQRPIAKRAKDGAFCPRS
jgi:hypothetical protein